MSTDQTDVRLIEAGFPCHQVGAETQRERGASSALPPLYFLHVWWARRPLTPSRAAILASIMPADTDKDWFLRQLGIEKVQALVNGEPWILLGNLRSRIQVNSKGQVYLPVDRMVLRRLHQEQERREKNLNTIDKLETADPNFLNHPVIEQWKRDCRLLPTPLPEEGDVLEVIRVAADPALARERLEFKKSDIGKQFLGVNFSWDEEDLYGYERAFVHHPEHLLSSDSVVLDPTAGGGSIPFEALRLGNSIVANELNPVALVVLYATLYYPSIFGLNLATDVEQWGNRLLQHLEHGLRSLFPDHTALPAEERNALMRYLQNTPGLLNDYDYEEVKDFIYARQVTCPNCEGEAPLLNSCWLSKEDEQWGVSIIPDGRAKKGRVSIRTYRVKNKLGPRGEDPDYATVSGGVGTCIHCRQAIPAEEIKAQARGESAHGTWQDRMLCVVADRHQPQLDCDGQPRIFRTGQNASSVKTKKLRFFRPPNSQDLKALAEAERELNDRWEGWERQGLIPTEQVPEGHKTMEPLRAGMNRWCDMFTPRQLLGHLLLIEELNRLKPQIIEELGPERGKAVITYLQFMIDKGLDYNSKQTMWHTGRGVMAHAFTRHDFSLKWIFGEMVFSGPNSGAAWGLSQVLDAYKGIAKLLEPLHQRYTESEPPVRILYGTAANLDLEDASADVIVMDPPYYNNVQYAELSDYFYVWQKRTLKDLYPELFQRRLTNKSDEAVANPARAGSGVESNRQYQRMMREIFTECRRVLKEQGILTVMFTHKTIEAWEALTWSLIANDWTITSAMPVESEAAESTHQKDMAAAASSVFLTCRQRSSDTERAPATWTGFGGSGVAVKIREAVRKGLEEFQELDLNPVDEMVAGYGRALRVLSENWPVLDGDQEVSPARAMLEASAVVAQYQISRITRGRLTVTELNPEAAMTVTLYGIFNTHLFPYDKALNLARSLNIALDHREANYRVEGSMAGINPLSQQRRRGSGSQTASVFYAPLVRSGSKLRLVLPSERHPQRLEHPQTEWDVMQGLIRAYGEGDMPLARNYLQQHAAHRHQVILDLLEVWTREAADKKMYQEGQNILFGLKQ